MKKLVVDKIIRHYLKFVLLSNLVIDFIILKFNCI